MSAPQYAASRESSRSFLGRIPLHWQERRLKTISPHISVGIVVNPSDYVAEDGLPFIYGGDIAEGKVLFETSRRISPEDSRKNSKSRLEEGDLLTVRVGAPGVTAVVPGECAGGNCASVMLVRKGDYCSTWLCYVMNSRTVRFQVEVVQYGAAQEQFNIGHAINFWIPTPPVEEQFSIAAFLDRETGKIDALIAEQEKLIALLAEKRQATISHAVTKGLNPDAPMKDSGVPWLGEVPAHWSVGKIQNFARRESGHTPSRQHPEYWENCTVPWFTLADVHQIRDGKTDFVFETKELVSELGLANSSARLLPKGTVMLSRTASVGYAAIMGVDMATTQDFVNWVCRDDLLPEFLLLVLRGMKSEFDRLMIGSTHQTIYMPDVAKLMMAQPPVQEQREIVQALQVRLERFDLLARDAAQAVDLLRERRSALIAAAVTGQIDVRGVVEAEAA